MEYLNPIFWVSTIGSSLWSLVRSSPPENEIGKTDPKILGNEGFEVVIALTFIFR
jgi:hypothetical protein